MEGEEIKNQQDLKDHMDSLFYFSSKVPYQKQHLITTLQAAKSLIGINPNNPPAQMLKWIEFYISKFSDNFNNENQSSNQDKLEVVTIKEFSELINQNDKLLALDYIKHLYLVASPQYLAEYILELSLKKSISHVLFCWYIYKSLKNINDSGKLSFLELGVSALFDTTLKLKDADFIIICLYREIFDTIYIRYNTVHPQLMNLLKSARNKCEKERFYHLEKEIEPFIRSGRELGILSYVSTLNKNELNSDIIIQLDAIRSLIKYSSKNQGFTNEEIIQNSIDYNA